MRCLILLLLVSSVLVAEDKITQHTIQLESGPLSYSATVGSLTVLDAQETTKGEIGYTSYVKENGGRGRPITFAFNGGPGSSSIWLHLGAFGPKRVLAPEEGQKVSPPYSLVDNLETLLDVTDLVFIDPVGTGYSQADPKENAKNFYDLEADIRSIADFIRNYLIANNRWNSPKYIAGESYGGLRTCGLANYLQDSYSIYLNGLILISPAIDYQTFIFHPDNQIPYFLFLPTYAATAWQHGRLLPGATLEEAISKARQFAYETYAPALLKSFSLNSFEKEILYNQLAEYTGLPFETIRRHKGRINERVFQMEFFADEQKALGMYDTRTKGDYTDPMQIPFSQDPSVTSISGIFVGAFHDYLQTELDSRGPYKSLSLDVNSQWNYYPPSNLHSYPNLMNALRQALIINPDLKVFTGCGYFDCVTPFGAAEYCLDHLDLPEAYRSNCQLERYEGGHMYYLNPSARKKFKTDLVRFYQEH